MWSEPVLAASLLALAVASQAAPAAPPTFARDIAPIVYQNCSVCHHPGETGPFSLLTYEDVKKRAHQIEAVTQSRYMPPWPPQPGYGDFQDERRLTAQQISLIADWVRAGALEGAPSEIPPPPQFTANWQLGPPDLNSRYNLANAFARAGKLDQALEQFRIVAAAYPQSARLQSQFAALLARAGKWPEALAQFDKAIALDPSDETTRKNRDSLIKQMAAR
ncbi:MAG: tetratricopeptide repeat protein [Acidobacteriaceae bacterium]|nr:tetratricopeptide repeat protein [Acidobacteriaceae bacterium]